MKIEYLVTGAAGHLGWTVTQALLARGETVRVLVLPSDAHAPQLPDNVKVFVGDVRDPATLEPCFETDSDTALIVIHCAAIVTIASGFQQIVYDVNVTGVKNIVDLCVKHGVKKLVYVSSVHALPTPPKGEVIREIKDFDPLKVVGLYAQTKAEATEYVLNAVREKDLDATIVHPSGICGPNDFSHGYLTQLVRDWHDGRLSAGIRGGYDFVDVRDVANGILACCDIGRKGECYLLTNRYISVESIFEALYDLGGHKHIRTFIPLWFIKIVAPLAEFYYKCLKQKPLFTAYSIYTLGCNAEFSHEKATRELGFSPRPFRETLKDTMDWCDQAGLFDKD